MCGQEMNSFVNLLLQVWFAPVGAFMATFSDEFGVFDLTMVFQLVLELLFIWI